MRWPLVLALLAGLSCDGAGPVDYGLCLEATQQRYFFPQSQDLKLDLLLVVDTSPAMQGNADVLAHSLNRMVEALRTPWKHELPDLRIGVVSADLGAPRVPGCTANGDGGRLLHAPRVSGCTPPTDPWIAHGCQGANVFGASDSVERTKQALRCIGTLGSSGCRFARPLEAARRALDPSLGLNPGFLRKDAVLVLMFVTAGDDCSTARPDLFDPASKLLGALSPFRCFEHGVVCDGGNPDTPGLHTRCAPARNGWLHPVQDYVAFFKELKPAGRVVVLAVSGPTDTVRVQLEGGAPALAPSCSGVGQGTPAIRLEALTRAFGPQGHFNRGPTTICSEDYSPPLEVLSERLLMALGGQCLREFPLTRDCRLACGGGALGEDVVSDGECLEEADCVVYETTHTGDEDEAASVPRCPVDLFRDASRTDCGAACPCWRLVPSPMCAPKLDGSPYALQILRAPCVRPATGTVAVLACTTSLHPFGSPELLALPRCDAAR